MDPFAWGNTSVAGDKLTMKRLARIALWIVMLYVITIGLQACASKRPASQSKFDQPKYDLDRRHKR